MTAEAAQRHSERATLVAWREGDDEAFAELYRRYAPALKAYCRHRLGSPADAEDAAHETFMRAHAALHTFDAEAPLWPWLVTIASRHCTDLVRKRELAGRLGAVPGPGPGPDVDEQASARIRSAIARDALRQVPAGYRASLFLREFAGWSYAEIAEAQGTTLGAVRSALMRGRRDLAMRVRLVAEAQRAWPLPLGLPKSLEWARHEVRTLRDWVVRHAPALGPAFDAALVGALTLAAGASLVLSDTRPVLGGLPPGGTISGVVASARSLALPDPTGAAGGSSPATPSGLGGALGGLRPLPDGGPANLTLTEDDPWRPPGGITYVLVNQSTPPNETGFTVGLYADVYDTPGSLYLWVEPKVNGPVVGDVSPASEPNMPCAFNGTLSPLMCTVARTVLQELPP